MFTTMMNNQDLAIDHRLSSERSRRAAENRLMLMSIAETVIFCDTPTREDQDPHVNHCNFLALLQFRVNSGDHVLKENAAIQNDNMWPYCDCR